MSVDLSIVESTAQGRPWRIENPQLWLALRPYKLGISEQVKFAYPKMVSASHTYKNSHKDTRLLP